MKILTEKEQIQEKIKHIEKLLEYQDRILVPHRLRRAYLNDFRTFISKEKFIVLEYHIEKINETIKTLTDYKTFLTNTLNTL